MIDIKEIRIGNLLSRPGADKKVFFFWLLYHFRSRKRNAVADYVELDEYWLTKLFNKDADGIWFFELYTPGHPSSRFYIEKYPKAEGFTFRSRYEPANPHSHYKTLKYVHQLQNLYFVITGSELNISL